MVVYHVHETLTVTVSNVYLFTFYLPVLVLVLRELVLVLFFVLPLLVLTTADDVIHKPEVHSVLHCRQRGGGESRPRYAVKFGRVVVEICKQTDRQTYIHADCNTSPTYREQSNND